MTQFPYIGLWIIKMEVICPRVSSQLYMDPSLGLICKSLSRICRTKEYKLTGLSTEVNVSSWIHNMVLGKALYYVITIGIISTREDSIEASPLPSSGRLSLNIDGPFENMVGLLGFIFLLRFRGIAVLRSCCLLFFLFSLSILWMWVGCLIFSLASSFLVGQRPNPR